MRARTTSTIVFFALLMLPSCAATTTVNNSRTLIVSELKSWSGHYTDRDIFSDSTETNIHATCGTTQEACAAQINAFRMGMDFATKMLDQGGVVLHDMSKSLGVPTITAGGQ